MSQYGVYPVQNPTNFLINDIEYQQLYKESIESPDIFWARQAQRIDWMKPFSIVKNTQYAPDVSIKWFEDGELNVCVNCVDRHLVNHADKVALIWEGDERDQAKSITFKQLHQEVCKFANVLEQLGVKKGDVVTIYMPMIPEAAYAMLACARIGAIHSVVFGGFSPESLAGRISDCHSKFIVTANEGVRGGKRIPLKENVDAAIAKLTTSIEKVLVVDHTEKTVDMCEGRDVVYSDMMMQASSSHEAARMNAEDPLFILYTSGSTGTPKGVLHTTGGYIVYASLTHQYIFDCKPDDVYWCTADVGWITGHSYMIYGPLANGVTTLLFEGVPTYPDASRCWEVIDKHAVSIFYTAPTAIRALMRFGNNFLTSTSRASLRILGTVGEPINPEAWEWYHTNIGHGKCPIVDTWWQTETGGVLITPLPGATSLKPGSATRPFFGVQPALVDDQGNVQEGEAEGALVMLDSWPGQMRTVYGDHKRFVDTYFSQFPGKYFSGDGAKRDDDGYYWITGRMDDVLNVSGHRLGTAEVESAIDEHPDVVESAVVGFSHDVKGQGIYAFVTLLEGVKPTDELKSEIVKCVRSEIGGIAAPDLIQWAPGLPKTRSGKIMRRVLRKIANNDIANIGDTSTLADPSVVENLIKNKAS